MRQWYCSVKKIPKVNPTTIKPMSTNVQMHNYRPAEPTYHNLHKNGYDSIKDELAKSIEEWIAKYEGKLPFGTREGIPVEALKLGGYIHGMRSALRMIDMLPEYQHRGAIEVQIRGTRSLMATKHASARSVGDRDYFDYGNAGHIKGLNFALSNIDSKSAQQSPLKLIRSLEPIIYLKTAKEVKDATYEIHEELVDEMNLYDMPNEFVREVHHVYDVIMENPDEYIDYSYEKLKDEYRHTAISASGVEFIGKSKSNQSSAQTQSPQSGYNAQAVRGRKIDKFTKYHFRYGVNDPSTEYYIYEQGLVQYFYNDPLNPEYSEEGEYKLTPQQAKEVSEAGYSDERYNKLMDILEHQVKSPQSSAQNETNNIWAQIRKEYGITKNEMNAILELDKPIPHYKTSINVLKKLGWTDIELKRYGRRAEALEQLTHQELWTKYYEYEAFGQSNQYSAQTGGESKG